MPRPRKAIPTRFLNLGIREDLRARLDLHLYSEIEGRVPQGAYQEFFEGMLLDFFGDEQGRQSCL